MHVRSQRQVYKSDPALPDCMPRTEPKWRMIIRITNSTRCQLRDRYTSSPVYFHGDRTLTTFFPLSFNDALASAFQSVSMNRLMAARTSALVLPGGVKRSRGGLATADAMALTKPSKSLGRTLYTQLKGLSGCIPKRGGQGSSRGVVVRESQAQRVKFSMAHGGPRCAIP